MNKSAKALVLSTAILCATLLGSPALAQDNAWATGGLQKVTIPGLDLAYVKPGATLKQYTKVAMKPVSISFAKNWAEDVTAGTMARVQPADMTAIRTKLAHMLEMAVYSELKAGGYDLVSAVGEDVLYVEMDIVNLYISAPQLNSGRWSLGLALGLIGAALATIWERSAFPGLLDFSSDYRTTALFWEMHVGGAALDGFLALTVPFAMRELVVAKAPWRWALGAIAVLLAGYACLTTFSRGVYFAIPAGLLALLWLHGAQKRRLAP